MRNDGLDVFRCRIRSKHGRRHFGLAWQDFVRNMAWCYHSFSVTEDMGDTGDTGDTGDRKAEKQWENIWTRPLLSFSVQDASTRTKPGVHLHQFGLDAAGHFSVLRAHSMPNAFAPQLKSLSRSGVSRSAVRSKPKLLH